MSLLNRWNLYLHPFFLKISVVVFLFIPSLLPAETAKSETMRRKEMAISEHIRNQIEETLLSYYKRGSFLIDVNITLEKMAPKVQVKTKPKKAPPKKEESETEEKEEEVKLPGLPAPLNYNESEAPWEPAMLESTIAMLQEEGLSVKWMKILVYVAEKIFSQQDITFISGVAKIRSGFDETRGDIIQIKQLPFPKLMSPENEEKIPPSPDTILPEKKQESPAPDKSLNRWIIMVAGLLALLVILQLISIFRRPPPPLVTPSASLIEPLSLPEPLKSLGIKALASAGPGLGELKEGPGELKKAVVSSLIGEPDLSVEILRDWINHEKEGLEKVAKFIRAVDPRVLDLFSEYLGPVVVSQINERISRITGLEQEEITALFTGFRQEYETKHQIRQARFASEGIDGSTFYFLKKLEPYQIIDLVRDEPPGVVAIALAQIESETAGQILRELPPETRAKCAMEMGKLRKIPVTVYRDIAERLSKKAALISKIKFVTTDGVEALVSLMEKVDPETERSILSTVSEQDPTLAEELRKVYLTFTDLVKIPDKTLSEVLRTIDRDAVARALVNAGEEVKGKILNSLPDRLRTMISDTLESIQNTPLEEIEKARSQICQEIRKLARAGKIDLKKLLQE